MSESEAAIKTLTANGYTYHGGEYWKPPLGDSKKTSWLLDDLSKAKEEIERLKSAGSELIRFQSEMLQMRFDIEDDNLQERFRNAIVKSIDIRNSLPSYAESADPIQEVIPDFLIKMSEQMHSQDNRITADPIWFVCCDRPQITAEGYEEWFEVLDVNNEYEVIYSSKHDSNSIDVYNLPDGQEVFFMKSVRSVVRACLTESDANAFIKRKQHDYPKLYTYVESMHFCPQMVELRNWILSLGDSAKLAEIQGGDCEGQ